jgi:DNA-binding IclR family transcriptional regulator
MNALSAQPEALAVIEAYPGAQTVSRAVALLKAFNDAQPEWTLGDLAQHVGLHKTTVHRLLAALEVEGFVARSGASGGYRLGPEIIALGGCAMRSNDLRTVSRSALEELAAATGETATLEVLAGEQVVILDEVSSRYLLGLSQDVGARLPFHATATGKLLAAHLDAPRQTQLLSKELNRLTLHTVTQPDRLAEQLRQIQLDGTAVTNGELEAGFVAVAAPIVDASGRISAAVSVGGPETRLSGEALEWAIAQVRLAGQAISRQLGYRGGLNGSRGSTDNVT